MDSVGIGIVGCGTIAGAYLTAALKLPILDIRAVADLNPQAAQARADEFGLRAVPLDALFDDPAVDIVLNLTVPKAHVEVGLRALAAGKHVYSEKPLAIAFSDGQRLLTAAAAAGLRVGCAPDTFLGGAHQRARRLVDDGVLGAPVGGSATFLCPGHERWHPAPDFYYQAGGGPMLDMGPYYITDLVNLLGPVAQVAGMATMPAPVRTITSQPRAGQTVAVEVPTHVTGLLGFANGATVQIAMSFDVAGHRHLPLEIHGTEGSLIVPDPNFFGGDVQVLRKGGDWQDVATDLPFADANWRALGLADMAAAIRSGRPHRASGDLALHVLEVMEAVGRASDESRTIRLQTTVERPAPFDGL